MDEVEFKYGTVKNVKIGAYVLDNGKGDSFVMEMENFIGEKILFRPYVNGTGYVEGWYRNCSGYEYSFHESWIDFEMDMIDFEKGIKK